MRRRLESDAITRSRRLRETATDAERKLWFRLRSLKAQGFHFRRQVPFRGYYLDFAEHRLRLAVELDGSQHGMDRNRAHDEVRDGVLTREGYRVLRFFNAEVLKDIERVVDVIVHEAEGRRPPTRPAAPGDLPTRGR